MVKISNELPATYDLFVAGDFCPYSEVCNASVKIDSSLKDLLAWARLRILNLECPITDHGRPITKTGPALKAPPSAEALLAKFKIDICNLANNHIMDFGSTGAKDTLALLHNLGIDTVGISNVAEEAALVRSISGKRVAFVSFTENEFSTLAYDGWSAVPLDYYKQMRQIKAARELADYVVVQYHGGAEQYRYPSPGQKRYAHYLADLGASMVICHHSHCYSGYEIYNEVPIFYGLGNFYFPEHGNPDSWYAGLGLCVNLETDLMVNLVHLRYDLSGHKLSISDENNSSWVDDLDAINTIIGSDEKLAQAWSGFCAKNEFSLLSAVFRPARFIRHLAKKGFVRNYLRRKVSLGLFNMLRCETHREKLIDVIKKILYG